MTDGTDMESFQDTVTERRRHAEYLPSHSYGAYCHVCKTTLRDPRVPPFVNENNRCDHFEEPNLFDEAHIFYA